MCDDREGLSVLVEFLRNLVDESVATSPNVIFPSLPCCALMPK